MSRPLVYLALFSALVVFGCGSPAENTGDAPASTTSSGDAEPSQGELKVGMDVAEVKRIKGAPDESRHEHGPAGEEIDVWIWKDVSATISDGKVIEVEKR